MEWNKGFSAQYYCSIVDPATWRDLRRIELTGGSVSKSTTSLMESASLDLTELPNGIEAWIRIWLDTKQSDAGAHEAVFTGLVSTPSTQWNGLLKSYDAECYSVLKPANDVSMPKGWYAPAGSNGAMLAASLLSIGAPPVEYAEPSPTLYSSIIAENNETNLSMAWKIINAIGWRIRINGYGNISICPKAVEASVTLDALANDCVELDVKDTRDLFSCPNVFRATFDKMTAVARDDDPDSPLSTVSRGREIWKEETNCKLNTGETLTQYTRRRLRELQAPARAVSYKRRYIPDLFPGDMVQIHYPAQGINDIFRIMSQKVDLGYNAQTAEEVTEP